MDNEFSQASLEVPTIPDNFEATTGSTKTSFARAILELLRGATIRGVNVEQPQNFDLNELQNRIAALENQVSKGIQKQRIVAFSGIATTTLVTVPFDDIGTLAYTVDVTFLTANATLGTASWSLIEGSKQTNQCQIRVDGSAGPYKFEVAITTQPT